MSELKAVNVTEISFDGLFENRPEKIVSMVYSSVVAVVSVPLLYATIWHGRFGSDNKKTLVDLLASLLCWIMVFYAMVIQVIDILIYTVGPLPNSICFLQVYLKVAQQSKKGLFNKTLHIHFFTGKFADTLTP